MDMLPNMSRAEHAYNNRNGIATNPGLYDDGDLVVIEEEKYRYRISEWRYPDGSFLRDHMDAKSWKARSYTINLREFFNADGTLIGETDRV